MALKVWLPLSGDTTNYGLSGSTVFSNYSSNTYGNSILGGQALVTGAESRVFGNIIGTFNEISISAWVKEGVASTGDVILAIQDGTTDIALLEKTATGYKIAGLADEDLFTLTNGWNHIAVTADGTTVKAYLNGALVKEVAQTGTIAAASTILGYDFSISGKITAKEVVGDVTGLTYGNAWIGSICAVKIYDSVLSLFEITNEANGLVLNYSFNGIVSLGTGVDLPNGTTASTFGFGDKEYDLSGNGFDGSFGAENLPTTSSDTAMYSSSMDFTSSTGITSSNIRTNEFASRFTISVWAKGTGNILSIGNWAAVSASDANDWHNIVITSEGKKFVDGVEDTNATVGSMPVSTVQVVVGSGFSGKLSDLRIYVKQMTAAEVLALYKRKAAIDDSGKLAATEFVVNDEITAPSFSKNGVVSAVNIASWTGEQANPVDVTNFAIMQETGDVNATDVIEI